MIETLQVKLVWPIIHGSRPDFTYARQMCVWINVFGKITSKSLEMEQNSTVRIMAIGAVDRDV